MSLIYHFAVLRMGTTSPHAYSIYEMTNPPTDEQYVLDKAGEKWRYYYYERGLRSVEQLFDTEDEACRHLLRQIIADHYTRISSYHDIK